MKLNEYLKLERKKNKLTLMNLARKANISYGMLYRVEDESIKKPKPDLLKKIAEALNLEYQKLLKMAGYLEGVVEKRDVVEKKEYLIYDFQSCFQSSKKEVFKRSYIDSPDVDFYVSANTNNYVPFFTKNSILGLKKEENLGSAGKYLYRCNQDEKIYLLTTKNSEKKITHCFKYPNIIVPINVTSLNGSFYKITDIKF
jgi:transcriptional regulator with XRE-family HTH domain